MGILNLSFWVHRASGSQTLLLHPSGLEATLCSSMLKPATVPLRTWLWGYFVIPCRKRCNIKWRKTQEIVQRAPWRELPLADKRMDGYNQTIVPIVLIIPRLTISDKMSVWIFCYRRQIVYFDAGLFVVCYFVNGYSVVDIPSLDILSYIRRQQLSTVSTCMLPKPHWPTESSCFMLLT